MQTINESDRRQYLFWILMFVIVVLISVGVLMTMSEAGGLWPVGCLSLGSLGLIGGIITGR